ncbi:MAG: flagellar basal body protein FliL [Arcobacter sp.]|nr:MAG: flagellar basal body protein FliL [Arcobacter sp.]
MAEEKIEEEKKSGKNPMMVILIVLVVILLLAIGGIVYFLNEKGIFSDKPINSTSVQTTEKKVNIEKEEVGETFQAKIDSLVLNITDVKGRAKLMKLSFTMKSNEPTIEALVEANKAEMVDSVIRQVSARTSEELLTVGGKAMLKEEMIDEANNILNDATDGNEDIKKNMILDIFFTSFVIK